MSKTGNSDRFVVSALPSLRRSAERRPLRDVFFRREAEASLYLAANANATTTTTANATAGDLRFAQNDSGKRIVAIDETTAGVTAKCRGLFTALRFGRDDLGLWWFFCSCTASVEMRGFCGQVRAFLWTDACSVCNCR